jgi:GrpB-like predicted nucleotidyltransferase (UPF0157 family)
MSEFARVMNLGVLVKIEEAAAEIRKANPRMTEAVAFTQALQADPDLYDRYVTWQREHARRAG